MRSSSGKAPVRVSPVWAGEYRITPIVHRRTEGQCTTSWRSALWSTRFKLQSRLHSTSLRTSFRTRVWGEPRTNRELFDILERADLLPNRLASDSTSLDTEQTVIALLVLTAAGYGNVRWSRWWIRFSG